MTEETERAVLAGGCFWGVEELVRKLPGVISTRVGYTGGDVADATYRNHGTHAEGIEIMFDPSETSYRDLLEFFFQIHDPTTKNRQGNDHRAQLPVGHLLHLRRAAHDCRRDDRRRRRVGTVAGQGRHRSGAGRTILGGRAGAPGLPAALPQRLHLPLREAGLETPPPPGRVVVGRPAALISRPTSAALASRCGAAQVSSSERPASMRDHWAMGRPFVRHTSGFLASPQGWGQPSGESSHVSWRP